MELIVALMLFRIPISVIIKFILHRGTLIWPSDPIAPEYCILTTERINKHVNTSYTFLPS